MIILYENGAFRLFGPENVNPQEDIETLEDVIKECEYSDMQWEEGLITTRERNNFFFAKLLELSNPVDVRAILGILRTRHVKLTKKQTERRAERNNKES